MMMMMMEKKNKDVDDQNPTERCLKNKGAILITHDA
jgi:hypothetical protein